MYDQILQFFCLYIYVLYLCFSLICASLPLNFKDPETAEQDVRRPYRSQQQNSQVRFE